MKDQELFELCKQLHQATGWADADEVLRKYSLSDNPIRLYRPPAGTDLMVPSGDLEWEIPLYTSDYLLEKLPDWIKHGRLTLKKQNTTQWSASYDFGRQEDYIVVSGVPLIALLKLCLALKEAGELK